MARHTRSPYGWQILLCVASLGLVFPPLVLAQQVDETLPFVPRVKARAVKADGVTPVTSHDFAPHLIDFSKIRVDPYSTDSADLTPYARLWDARAAAVLRTAGENLDGITAESLICKNGYEKNDVPTLDPPNPEVCERTLALMAYFDFFRDAPDGERARIDTAVSHAILASKPGWAGTFGPGMNDWTLAFATFIEGNYDMNLMYLIPLAYRYAHRLSADAQDHLVNALIANAHLERANLDPGKIAGPVPDDWPRAGQVPGKRIGETENHILMIATARYLANQLVYQRQPDRLFNNRENAHDGGPATTDLILSLLRDILRGDFSEYNAKPYQKESRLALLNLASYAYDPEVRLAARMALDYVAAHIAVTSNDLRRMMPFRRINNYVNSRWNAGLLDWQLGADPLVPFFALQTGNTRALTARKYDPAWDPAAPIGLDVPAGMLANEGYEIAVEVVSDYRLPPAIHDLFVTDKHRRFYQRMHRMEQPGEAAGGRNCDNFELTASSPSYLITAGGAPCPHAINPYALGIAWGSAEEQLGIPVATSFMPTRLKSDSTITDGRGLIQIGRDSGVWHNSGEYGVAPDLMFGNGLWLPEWVTAAATPPVSGFRFVDQRPDDARARPGFFLAIYQTPEFGLVEAFDTWLHPDITFEQFKAGVLARNPGFSIRNRRETTYTTSRGHRVRFAIFHGGTDPNPASRHCGPDTGARCQRGTMLLGIDYAGTHDRPCELTGYLRFDCMGDAGNTRNRFLNGTILYSPSEAVVRISNPYRDETITLDLSSKWNPRRTNELGAIETKYHQVWVDFDHGGPEEGNFYQPFRSLESAVAAVDDGGTIIIKPGSMTEPQTIRSPKRLRVISPVAFKIGGR